MLRVLQNAFYYLDNFQRVLDWIAEHYADLLIEEEQAFIAAFPALPRPARALFVRLVMRRGTLFRTSRLDYPEIGCPLAAAQALPVDWIAHDPVLCLDELFDVLTKPELAKVLRLPAALKSARKPEQLAGLRDDPTLLRARPYSEWVGAHGDSALRLLVQPLCDRLRLIFFGNLHQDWSEFVLSDLGLLRYEQVTFSKGGRGLRNRSDIARYLHLHACKERLLAGDAVADILAALGARPTTQPPDGEGNAWLDSRHERLMFQLAQTLEKQKDWEGAHALYADCRYPGARGRAMRVLEKDGKFAQAHALWTAAQAAPESEAERQQLLRIGPRLARQLGYPRCAARPAAPVERLALALPMRTDVRVEALVLAHLAQEAAPVFYVENTLANALFGLLCWPAVFAAIPGAFFHPFHRGPADLYDAHFHARRRAEFDACLALLDNGDYRQAILTTHDAKRGLQSPFVAWDWIDRALLETALASIPAAHLKLWCLRILQDVRENRSGFPDLIQFWPQQQRYRMIEVKGPGDRLQDNQLRWIAYCVLHEMPVAVCYLQWAAAA